MNGYSETDQGPIMIREEILYHSMTQEQNGNQVGGYHSYGDDEG